MIPHFFVAPDQLGAGEALLDADDTRHLVTVLRARSGAEVSVSDGRGTIWSATFEGVTDGAARVALGSSLVRPAPSPLLTVVHALPKQRKLDDVVQRLTEVGVDRIVPVHSRRSQVELDERRAAKAVARWRAVALAAAKQARRAWLPQVDEVGEWDSAFSADDLGVVCWEESTVGLRTALSGLMQPAAVVIGIGPEGGLTADEVALTGLLHASLGRSVLRTETAALVAAAAVRYHYGLMENP